MKRSTFLTGAALLVGAAPALAQTAQPLRVRGVIGDFKDGVLTVSTSKGPVKVTLAPDARLRALAKFSLADIKPGTFLGTTAMPQSDGTLKAVEVHVFPPEQAAQKPGEGFRPNDYAPNATMTNATVSNIAAATVEGVQNRVLTLTYNGGEKKVVVSATTPVFTYVPATRADLVAGTRVALNATQGTDGYTTSDVTLDKNGLDPRS